jgi:chromosome partitioning protein
MSMDFLKRWFDRPVRPRVVVLGNQKGGSGKSTAAMHLTVGLLHCGYGVGSVDLDSGQATLSHFVGNRKRFAETSGAPLAMPTHRRVESSSEKSLAAAEAEEAAAVAEAFEALVDQDYIIVDTPGSDTFLSRLGHVLADTLITPVNDSYLDLDVLVRIDPDGKTITGPSGYSVAVLDRWGLRMMVGGRPLDWIVIRNRLAHLHTRNHRHLEVLLHKLAPALGFRLAPGFGERVIFRENFVQGLTILDQPEPSKWRLPSSSHSAARKEVWALIEAIGLSEAGLSEGGRGATVPAAKASAV